MLLGDWAMWFQEWVLLARELVNPLEEWTVPLTEWASCQQLTLTLLYCCSCPYLFDLLPCPETSCSHPPPKSVVVVRWPTLQCIRDVDCWIEWSRYIDAWVPSLNVRWIYLRCTSDPMAHVDWVNGRYKNEWVHSSSRVCCYWFTKEYVSGNRASKPE